MVIIMKPGTKQERIQTLVTQLEQEHGVKVGITNGVGCSILGHERRCGAGHAGAGAL